MNNREFSKEAAGTAIDLRLGFYRFTDSKRLLNICKAIDSIDINQYPLIPEDKELINLLYQYNKRDFDMSGDILFCNGGDGGITLTLLYYKLQEFSFILPVPCFDIYNWYLTNIKANVTEVAFDSVVEYPLDKILKEIEKGKQCLVLSNPNNPLGCLISNNHLEMILVALKRHKGILILDECDYEITQITGAKFIKEYDNVIIIRTFSKAFGISGVRFGYLLGQSSIIKGLRSLRGPFEVSRVSIFFAKYILKNIDLYLDLIEFHKEKGIFEAELKERGLKVFTTYGNFITFFCDKGDDLYSYLDNKGIKSRTLSNYPSHFGLLTNCLRFAVPRTIERNIVLSHIDGFLNKAKSF